MSAERSNSLQSQSDLSPLARRLAGLLPGIYLSRNDAVLGYESQGAGATQLHRPLLPLLEVLAAPLQELERAIVQLEDDHFVERCSLEALAHLAELVGARLLNETRAANRGIVARTLHWRRRKGTLATLEDVLEVTTGWSTEVDEAYRSLLHTQDLANPVPWRGRTAVLWDPIALADPLSRRAPQAERPRSGEILRTPVLTRLPGESMETTLRRLGRADAGRYAASPRNIDFNDWARPEIVVIRSSRFEQRELDRVSIETLRTVPHRDDPQLGFIGFHLDPAQRDRPLVAREERDPVALTGGLTSAHEPQQEPSQASYRYGLLTPTLLAADGDAVEQADNLSLFIDGVPIVGETTPPEGQGALAYRAAGPSAVLRFADLRRPSPGEEWRIDLLAIDDTSLLRADTPVSPDLAEPGGGAQNPVLARTLARRGSRDTAFTTLAQVDRSGAQVSLRLSRPLAGGGYLRGADGRWSNRPLAAPAGQPLSDLALLGDDGDRQAVRLIRLAGQSETLILQRSHMDPASEAWGQADIDWGGIDSARQPQRRPRRRGPAFILLAHDVSLLLVGPQSDAAGMGVWRIEDALTDNAGTLRLDQGDDMPPARWLASACLRQEVLYLFGGEDDAGQILGDLWSMALTGPEAGAWRLHRVRNRQIRSGGRLLGSAEGLMLLGGATRLGAFESSVFALDLGRAKLRWEPLPTLPAEPDAPGVLWAAIREEGLEALLWANRLWPRRAYLPFGALRWQLGPAEREASPNPPAEGEVIHHADRWWVLGPPPLPPSEILLRLSGDGHLVFLPAIDLLQRDDWALYPVATDGSSEQWFAPGEEAAFSLRLGSSRNDAVLGRKAGPGRLGALGRLRWEPMKLRQRNLGPWHRPLVLDLEDTVALDPRLGRVLLPGDIDQGRFQASYRIARSCALGAGFMPGNGGLDEHWREPEDYLAPSEPPQFAGYTVNAWIDPDAAGAGKTGQETPLFPGIPEALLRTTSPYVFGVKGSPQLPPQRLAIGEGDMLSLYAAAGGAFPVIARDQDGASLSLQEKLGGNRSAALGPSYWLCGLMLEGGLDVALGAGQVQLRWCDLAAPGETALRVAGSGHQSGLALRSIPAPSVRIWLYGCVLGRIELPPWVQLVAAGCLIDGGDDQAPAIQAPGARLRLRHCTVRGRTLAGELAASSCVFQGEIHAARPDLGWLRYCLSSEGKRLPLQYQSRFHGVSFASTRVTDPHYLVLSPNNGEAALQAGERRRLPGAHAALTASLTELVARTDEFLPLSLVSHQVDRARIDLHRMNRREL